MRRSCGIPPARPGRPGRAVDQLQRAYPPPAVIEPLPVPITPGRVTPAQLGITDSETVTFLLFGDCGGIADPNPQKMVAGAIAQLRQAGVAPAFALIAGDLVYFNGDPEQWVPQFYEPYCHSLGGIPVIAFPGNHDGDSSDGVAGSGLASFIANLCTTSPAVPPGDPQFEYERHTQTLPYCDWTLELQALTIIAVWSNVPSGGHLEPSQIDWLTAELKAARPRIPVMVGVHHPPYSIDAHHGGSTKMGQILDGCFQAAGRCADIVVSGHVHDYQRFTRTWTIYGPAELKKIPYLVSGNGGYHNLHQLATGATAGKEVVPNVVYEAGDDQNWGLLIVTAGAGKLAGEYVSVAKDGMVKRGADTFTIPAP